MAHDRQSQVAKLVTFAASLAAKFFYTVHCNQSGRSLECCYDCLKRLEIHVEDLYTSDFNPIVFCGFLVLSNPETRSIYDVYGQKGLDAGWEVRLNGSETDILPLEKRKTEISQFYSLFRLLKDKEHLLKYVRLH